MNRTWNWNIRGGSMLASAGSALVAVPTATTWPNVGFDRRGVAVGRLRAAEDVAVVEQVEAFQPQQERASAGLDAALDEQRDVLRAGAAERRLADHRAVDDRPIVVRAVAVVVDAGGRVERPRRRELRQRAGGDVVRAAGSWT